MRAIAAVEGEATPSGSPRSWKTSRANATSPSSLKEVVHPVQYGLGVKANSVYMSEYQMIPYNRIEELFIDQMQIPVSAGSIVNFNKEAYERLEFFDNWLKEQLAFPALVHINE